MNNTVSSQSACSLTATHATPPANAQNAPITTTAFVQGVRGNLRSVNMAAPNKAHYSRRPMMLE
jgi:hypothetical protein